MPRFLTTQRIAVVGVCLATAGWLHPPAGAAPPHEQTKPPTHFAADVPAGTTTLARYRALALAQHPQIAAARLSLGAAIDGQQALEALAVPGLVSHQLAVRRQQSELGVTAAAALVEQAAQLTLYDVDRTYFTVLFARDQERLARGVVARLTTVHDAAKKQLDAGAKDVTTTDVSRALIYLRLAETRRAEAANGVERALAALRQALGQGPEFCVEVPAARLPVPTARPERCAVVAAALARRAELVQARVFADVAGLEIKAQDATHLNRVPTFAAGADVHARTVPQAERDRDYRPGAIPPEMPTLLVGKREDRVQRAASLHGRAEQVVRHTRTVIGLEADDAFLRWQKAEQQLAAVRGAAETGEQLADDIAKDFAANQKVRVEDVVSNRVLASQARSQYNETLYNLIVALADLERVTGGGFCAHLAELAPPRP